METCPTAQHNKNYQAYMALKFLITRERKPWSHTFRSCDELQLEHHTLPE
jgi:hypothetical protein